MLVHEGPGTFAVKPDKMSQPSLVSYKKINMIAGGTGITPMLQLIRAALKNPEDTTQMALLFCNQTEEDILLREELEEAAAGAPDRLKIWVDQ